jgi:nickel-dependent lactate racemase
VGQNENNDHNNNHAFANIGVLSAGIPCKRVVPHSEADKYTKSDSYNCVKHYGRGSGGGTGFAICAKHGLPIAVMVLKHSEVSCL